MASPAEPQQSVVSPVEPNQSVASPAEPNQPPSSSLPSKRVAGESSDATQGKKRKEAPSSDAGSVD